MKDADKDKKVDLLISALEERYEVLRTIRNRVQSVGIWALGILLAAGGWLVESGTVLTPLQKVLYFIGIIVAVAALRFKYLDDLERGFKSQQRVMVRLEKAAGFFTPGVFDDETDSVYPSTWENTGNKNGDGKFFKTTYLLLYIGTAFLLLVILLNGYNSHHDYRSRTSEAQSFFTH